MKLRPNVPYTKEEVAAFRDSPELAGLALKGYVFTITLDGMFMLVPWNQAAGGGFRGRAAHSGEFIDATEQGTQYGRPVTVDLTEQRREILKPIVKRTPQQRMESLMEKVGEDLRFYLSGQAGREITGEETKKVAQQVMEETEKKFEEAERKRVTRTTGNPYA